MRLPAFFRPAVWPAAVAFVIGVAACSSPSTPSPLLQISCPVVPSAESLTGAPVPVEFVSPTTTGGSSPVTISCSHTSGSSFAVGTTPVSCTATDAQQKTAACTIPVTVTQPGDLSATRFMAFGDSITEGSLGSPCPSQPGPEPTARTGSKWRAMMLDDGRRIRAYASSPTSYPSVLQNLLTARYLTQTIVVANEGLGGEFITDGITEEEWGTNDETLTRLRNRLTANAAQVLLLQEGVNDLNINPLHPEVSIPAVVKGLQDAAREARNRGAQVLIGTLLPQNAAGCRGFAAPHIAAANDQIRAMALADGLILVDLYQAFGGVPAPYIGFDGLHPNEIGYQKMADTFLAAIKQRLEVPR